MAKRLPVEVQKQIDEMAEAFRQRLTELFQWSNDEETDRPPTAAEIEDKLREWIRQIGEDTQMLVLGGYGTLSSQRQTALSAMPGRSVLG